jgi:hypothetical protein
MCSNINVVKICADYYRVVRFKVLTAASMKIDTAFWDVPPYSHVGVDRCFRGAYCHNHQSDDD